MLSNITSKIKNWLNLQKSLKGHDDSVMQLYSQSLTNYAFGCCDGSYDNNFASIVRIAEAIAEVIPYAIDAKGKRIKTDPNIVRVLHNPNQEMSSADFMETLATMLLVHPIVYLLCWRSEGNDLAPGGPITEPNLRGLTFLENVSKTIIDGSVTYYAGDQVYTQNDVIELSLNVNPYSLLNGYSPSIAAKKWATVDDYVADYQAGYFANGAVPAGQFNITAPTKEAFHEMVESM